MAMITQAQLKTMLANGQTPAAGTTVNMATSGAANPVPYATAMARLNLSVAAPKTPAPTYVSVNDIVKAGLSSQLGPTNSSGQVQTSDPNAPYYVDPATLKSLQSQAITINMNAAAQQVLATQNATTPTSSTALTPTQQADIAAKAKAAGLTGTYASYDALNTALNAQAALKTEIANKAKAAGLTGTYNDYASLDQALKAAGIGIQSSQVASIQNIQAATEQAAAVKAQQAALDQAEAAFKLPDLAGYTGSTILTNPKSTMTFTAIPPNPMTGDPGGWYKQVAGGYVKVDPVTKSPAANATTVSTTDFNKAYQTQQADKITFGQTVDNSLSRYRTQLESAYPQGANAAQRAAIEQKIAAAKQLLTSSGNATELQNKATGLGLIENYDKAYNAAISTNTDPAYVKQQQDARAAFLNNLNSSYKSSATDFSKLVDTANNAIAQTQQETKVYVNPSAYFDASKYDPRALQALGIDPKNASKLQNSNPYAANYIGVNPDQIQQVVDHYKQIDTAQANFKLPEAAGFYEYNGQGKGIISPDGKTQYLAIPADPLTKEPAKWIQTTDNWQTATQVGADPKTAKNYTWDGVAQLQKAAVQDQTYYSQLSSSAKAAIDSKPALIKEGETNIGSLITRADFNYDKLKSSIDNARAAGYTGDQLYNGTLAAISNAAEAERQAQLAAFNEKVANYNKQDISIGEMGDVLKIAAVVGLAYGASALIGSLAGAGEAATAGEALLGSEMGAAAAEASAMAEAGASASEIAAALEAGGMDAAAAESLAGAAAEIGVGEVTAADLAGLGIDPGTVATLEEAAAASGAVAPEGIVAGEAAGAVAPEAIGAEAAGAVAPEAIGAEVAGEAAAAEAAGAIAPESIATGAVDTSQMIPTVDAAGNPGFFDPATGQIYDETGLKILGPKETAEVVSSIDPEMVNNLAPATQGSSRAAAIEAANPGYQVVNPPDVTAPYWNEAAGTYQLPDGTYYNTSVDAWLKPTSAASTPIVPSGLSDLSSTAIESSAIGGGGAVGAGEIASAAGGVGGSAATGEIAAAAANAAEGAAVSGAISPAAVGSAATSAAEAAAASQGWTPLTVGGKVLSAAEVAGAADALAAATGTAVSPLTAATAIGAAVAAGLGSVVSAGAAAVSGAVSAVTGAATGGTAAAGGTATGGAVTTPVTPTTPISPESIPAPGTTTPTGGTTGATTPGGTTGGTAETGGGTTGTGTAITGATTPGGTTGGTATTGGTTTPSGPVTPETVAQPGTTGGTTGGTTTTPVTPETVAQPGTTATGGTPTTPTTPGATAGGGTITPNAPISPELVGAGAVGAGAIAAGGGAGATGGTTITTPGGVETTPGTPVGTGGGTNLGSGTTPGTTGTGTTAPGAGTGTGTTGGTTPGTGTTGTGTTPGVGTGTGGGTGTTPGTGTGTGPGVGTGGGTGGGTGTTPTTPVTPVTPTTPLTPITTEVIPPTTPITPVEVIPPSTIPPGEVVPEPTTPTTPTEPVGSGLSPWLLTPLLLPLVLDQGPGGRPYRPTPPVEWGTANPLTYPGLNPGWIAPEPYYQTTSPVQSKFYWGQHPYQPGSTFDLALYNQVPAPAQPWGLQQARSPFDVNKFIAETILSPGYQAAARGEVAPTTGPIAPAK